MSQNMDIIPTNDGHMSMVSAHDLKQLALVNAVHTRLEDPAVHTITEALKLAEVPRSTFYMALRNPYVQAEKLAEVHARRDAVHVLLQRYWTHTVQTQVAIANDTSHPREAVQAANLLHRLLQESEEEIESIEEIGGETEATRFLKEFKTRTKGRMRAKRTTTVEEIEVDE